MVAPVGVSLLLILWLAFMLDSAGQELEVEARAKELHKECSTITYYVETATKAVNHFYVSNGNNSDEMDSAQKSLNLIEDELVRVQKLLKNNPEQQETLATILLLRDRLNSVFSACQDRPTPVELDHLWQVGAHLELELRKLTSYEVRGASDARKRSTRQVLKFLLYGTFLDIAVGILLVIFFVRPIIRRLALLDDNNHRFARQEALVPFAAGNDEIAEIDHRFRDMVSTLSEFVRKEQAMVENANDIICSTDRTLRFLKVNYAIVAALGYEQKEVLGKSLLDFVPELQVEEARLNVAKAMEQPQAQSFDITMKRKDGTMAIFSCGAHWSAEDRALFCVLHDITERKRIAQLKQDFVAMISHDLRTPLMSIQATLTILLEGQYGEMKPAGKKTIKAAERNTRSLLNLITEILDIEKIESGKFTLAKEAVCIDVVIERATELVVNLAERREVSVEAKHSEIWVYVDPDRMVQVITNLLSNAIKYSPKRSKIVISVSRLPESIEIRVTDQGKGIPQHMHKAIFDRFQQVELADSTEKGGSGLGLAICKSIVQAHEGSVGVDSEEGKGSSFWVWLPADPAVE